MPQTRNSGAGWPLTDARLHIPETALGRRDWIIAAALFIATIISRLPFRTGMLYAWDSVLYALALDRFDVTIHQPQPPGHIFYVGLVWAVNALLAAPNASMVWVSMLASAAAVAALYFLGKIMFNRSVGLLAALLLASSATFWAYGEVAYPYTLLALLTVAVAGSVYMTWVGKRGWVLPAALLLGVAAGFRQDILPFMLPLFLVGLAGKGWLRALGAGAILVATTAAWYIPSALMSGGFSSYRAASDIQSDYMFKYFSVFGRGLDGVGFNLRELGNFLLQGLTSALVLLAAVFFITPFAGRLRSMLKDRRLIFLLLWMGPSLLFFVFIHVGEYGYVFSILPALLLLASWGLYRITESGAAGNSVNLPFAIVGTLLVAANLVLFLWGGTPFSANRIEARDQILKMRIEAIRDNFDPASTLIVSEFDYQQARYYLPEFAEIWNFDPAVEKRPTVALPPGTEKVILFEDYLKAADGRASSIKLDRGQELIFLETRGQETVRVDADKKEVSVD